MGFNVFDGRGSRCRRRGHHWPRIGAAAFDQHRRTFGADLLRLRKLHEAAGHLAQTAPDILAKPEVARAMELALVEAMVFCLTDSRSDQMHNVRRHRARVMRRLEEALMENR